MRASVCALVFLLGTSLCLRSRATLVLYEPFNYPVGDTLDGIDGASIVSGGKTAPNGNKWYPSGYSTQANYNAFDGTQVVGLNLGVAGLKEPVGNAVWYGGGGYSTRVATFPINSGTVYSSFAFRIFDIAGLPSVGGIVAAFNNSNGPQTSAPTVFAGSLWVRPTLDTTDNPANYNIGISKTSSSS